MKRSEFLKAILVSPFGVGAAMAEKPEDLVSAELGGKCANWSSPIKITRSDFPRYTACQFDFKSQACGYKGPVKSCDKSFGNCLDLGNRARFGGWPMSRELMQSIDQANAFDEFLRSQK